MTDMDNRAQRIVAQGIGEHVPDGIFPGDYVVGTNEFTAEQFCLDGRVVLALMEKCTAVRFTDYGKIGGRKIYGACAGGKYVENDSLAIAIVDACLEALERSKECPCCKEISLVPSGYEPMYECENCGAEVQL